jgi:hypothetical protein
MRSKKQYAMAGMKRKLHDVNETAPSVAVATVLTSSHFRMLATISCLVIAFWFGFSMLHLKCDFEDSGVLDLVQETTIFDNNPSAAESARNDVSSVHWIECESPVTADNLTRITFTQQFVKVLWNEKNELRCIREGAKTGRDLAQISIYTLGALIAVGAALQWYAYMQDKVHSDHVKAMMWMNVFHVLAHVFIIASLSYIVDYLYFATEDDEQRNVSKGVHWLELKRVVSGIFAGLFGVAYAIGYIKSGSLFFTKKSSKDAKDAKDGMEMMQLSNGDVTETRNFRYRYVRTDTMFTQHRHENLTMAAIFTVLAVLSSTAIQIHKEKPGVHKYEIISAPMLDDVLTSTDGASYSTNTLFDNNCTVGRPFRMNVTMWDDVISTTHHTKYHMPSESTGSIVVLSIVSFWAVLEALSTFLLWWRQTNKLLHTVDPVSGDYNSEDRDLRKDPPIMDIFFSWVPLATHTLSVCGVVFPVLAIGYGIANHEHKLAHWTLAGAIVLTLSWLIQFGHFSIFLNHRLTHPRVTKKDSTS